MTKICSKIIVGTRSKNLSSYVLRKFIYIKALRGAAAGTKSSVRSGVALTKTYD